MISGAAGAMTVIMGDLTSDSGPMRAFTREERVEQLLMCVVLIGALEVLLAPLLNAFVKVRRGRKMSVMDGCTMMNLTGRCGEKQPRNRAAGVGVK